MIHLIHKSDIENHIDDLKKPMYSKITLKYERQWMIALVVCENVIWDTVRIELYEQVKVSMWNFNERNLR